MLLFYFFKNCYLGSARIWGSKKMWAQKNTQKEKMQILLNCDFCKADFKISPSGKQR